MLVITDEQSGEVTIVTENEDAAGNITQRTTTYDANGNETSDTQTETSSPSGDPDPSDASGGADPSGQSDPAGQAQGGDEGSQPGSDPDGDPGGSAPGMDGGGGGGTDGGSLPADDGTDDTPRGPGPIVGHTGLAFNATQAGAGDDWDNGPQRDGYVDTQLNSLLGGVNDIGSGAGPADLGHGPITLDVSLPPPAGVDGDWGESDNPRAFTDLALALQPTLGASAAAMAVSSAP